MSQFGEYWTSEKFAGNRYKLYPKDGYFATSSSAITRPLIVPFAHRIIRLEFTHLDASNVLNTTALYLEMRESQAKRRPPNSQNTLFREYDMTAKDGIEPFGEGFEYPATVWDFLMHTTSGHRIIPILVIMKIGD